MKIVHKENEEIKTKQYNCNDCPFQGENGLELKRHIQRTMHTPSDYKEECYTCNKEFTSYWALMNHRKSDHPSTKKCRYFLKNECKFSEDTCWYKHELESKIQEKRQLLNFPCNDCEHVFEHRYQLMKHRKIEHIDKVSNCRVFSQGKCKLDENSCWFGHKEKESEEMEIDEGINELGFHKAPEKTPPDQMKTIMDMIKKLSVQVEQLERISQKTQ